MSNLTDSTFYLQAQNAILSGQGNVKVGHARNLAEARRVAQEFEAVFIGQMLQPIFQNLSAEEPFGGGSSEDIWRSMQVDEYGKAITKAGGIGIAETRLDSILRAELREPRHV